MAVNFSYDKRTDDYEIDDPEWGGMCLTISQTRRFVDLVRRTHPELLEKTPNKKPVESEPGDPSKKWARVAKSPQQEACDTIPSILIGSERGMTIDQITLHFHGNVAKRTVQESLKKLVKEGKVVKEPYWRDMRVPVYRMKEKTTTEKEANKCSTQ